MPDRGRRQVTADLRQTVEMRPAYRIGEPVILTCTLRNAGQADCALLVWNTPLEGEMFAFAEVFNGDRIISYDGRLVSRVDPQPGSYQVIRPGQSVTRELDLSTSFALTEPGRYTVTLAIRFHDVIEHQGGNVPAARRRAEHEPLSLDQVSAGFELLPGDKARLTSGQHARAAQQARADSTTHGPGDFPVPPPGWPATDIADQNAIAWLTAAEAELASWTARSDNALYTEWFGEDLIDRYQTIQAHIASLRTRLGQPHTYDSSETGCPTDAAAYTFPGSGTIYICQPWINAQAVGTDSQYGILIHEWSHAVLNTQDIAYGEDPCRALAVRSPGFAAMNADNHKYIVETLAGRMLTGPVVWNNGKAYFFAAGKYWRYDIAADKVDPGYPLPIAGAWTGLWADRIDAAVVWNNGKAYFFRDGEYMRYDIATDRADAGYPLPIAQYWPGLGGAKIDAVAFWPNGKAYFFRGSQYWRYDIAADRVDPGYPLPIAGNWPGVWSEGLTGAVVWPNRKAYFFRGWQYLRYDIAADRGDGGFPKAIAENWPFLPADGVSAAVMWGNGKAYFFRGTNYYRYDLATDRVDPGYPLPIGPNWPGLGGDPIDAALVGPNGKAYFFRETQYWRYDIAADLVDPGYPADLGAGWPGIPDYPLGAAVYWPNGKVYFFRNSLYWRFDWAANRVDDGYPLDIGQFWPGLGDGAINSPIVWNNGKAYFFRGPWYWRYDIAADRVDDGFPSRLGSNWPGLPGRVR